MIATVFEVIERVQSTQVRMAGLNNFRLREQGQLLASDILGNPHITLYSLDFERKEAVFVETPPDVDLSQAPFFVTAQHDHAKRVCTISFDTMIELAQSEPYAPIHVRAAGSMTAVPDLPVNSEFDEPAPDSSES